MYVISNTIKKNKGMMNKIKGNVTSEGKEMGTQSGKVYMGTSKVLIMF